MDQSDTVAVDQAVDQGTPLIVDFASSEENTKPKGKKPDHWKQIVQESI